MCGNSKQKSQSNSQQITDAYNKTSSASFVDSFNSPVTNTFAKEESFSNVQDSNNVSNAYNFDLNIESSELGGGVGVSTPTPTNLQESTGQAVFSNPSTMNLGLIGLGIVGIGIFIMQRKGK